jgi:hypothetical protein
MPSKIVNDSRVATCYHLFFEMDSRNFKNLILILSCLAREAHARGFAPSRGLRDPG